MSRASDTPSNEQTHPASDCEIAYVGYRQSGQAIVEKHPGQKRLTPSRSLKLAGHSSSGFEWEYGGSGPAQLALALLLDYTDDEDVALKEYMEFKTKVVSQLECTEPDGCWRLTGREIDAILRETVNEPVASSVD